MEELIESIDQATHYRAIFPDMTIWKEKYVAMVKLLHPDVSSSARAASALAKLNAWKDEIESGIPFQDDNGNARMFWDHLFFQADAEAPVFRSIDAYRMLEKRWGSGNHFRAYIPPCVKVDRGPVIFAHVNERTIPIALLKGPVAPHHGNWILSRMLEFSAGMEATGVVHCGLNPSSVCIAPRSHGVIIPTFYHTVSVGARLHSISRRYRHFYPENALTKKIASSDIDVEAAKRVAAFAMGAPGGNAVALRKKIDPSVIDFLLTHHASAIEAFYEWRTIITTKFPRVFHEFTDY